MKTNTKYNYNFKELIKNDKRFDGKVNLTHEVILEILINSIETKDWDLIKDLIVALKEN